MKLTTADMKRFDSYLKEADQAPFEGWDFSYADRYGGNPEEPTEWSYGAAVREYAQNARSVLDMGTGGGEFFASLHPLPGDSYATEAYPPNIPIAKRDLEPLGVTVVGIEDGVQEDFPLPFENRFFDLVINRHEAYDSREVYRVLDTGGVFITQQVGERNNQNLRRILGHTEDLLYFPWNLEACKGFLTETGFQIIKAKEQIGYNRFYDIRAVVYVLKVLPWEFPGFDPFKQRNQLLDIHLNILQDGFFDSVNHRFFVIAQKGG
jgi:SAM-dependent methyltransferase